MSPVLWVIFGVKVNRVVCLIYSWYVYIFFFKKNDVVSNRLMIFNDYRIFMCHVVTMICHAIRNFQKFFIVKHVLREGSTNNPTPHCINIVLTLLSNFFPIIIFHFWRNQNKIILYPWYSYTPNTLATWKILGCT